MQTAQQESLSQLSQKGTCLAFFTAYDDLDTARMIGLAAPDATVHFLPLGEAGKGSFWEFGKAVWDMLIDCFPDITNSVDSLATEEETIRANVTIEGTQAKDFLDIASKGMKFKSDHIFVFRFNEADRIQHLTITWDHASFVKQLSQE
ncbi:ester cyclase [Tellurirhabdus rosea]|uniref:ester cyclase n=1 Tax=Tellurirhabdus rosea TaxID=2674997 RepID=UPI00224D5F2A|nr:nuclear transport factor 2 family protein [Tellurirhabdus rosea]